MRTKFVSVLGGIALIALVPALSQPTQDWDLILPDGKLGTGLVEGAKILLPKGSTLILSTATTIRASDQLRIEGDVLLEDVVSASAGIDALDLTLEAGKRLTITGTIRGGAGFSYPELDKQEFLMKAGGKGSDLILVAPDLLVSGLLVSGEGGIGGVGAEGGPGGDIVCTGGFLSDHGLAASELEALSLRTAYFAECGGMGGIGSHALGVSPGDSGDTGSVLYLEFPGPAGGDIPEPGAPPLLPLSTACTDGIPGHSPGVATGRVGKAGRPGLDGIESSPDGQDGGGGGDGVDVTGAAAGNAGDGVDCCNPNATGGAGGAGGTGGAANGPAGGAGGAGGAAYMEETTYFGRGGRGGDSGNGASTTGGAGGDAGDGGDGVPPGMGGSGGPGGLATPGQPGQPGAGGAGSPAGLNGVSGTAGGAAPGDSGDAGNPGAICPGSGG